MKAFIIKFVAITIFFISSATAKPNKIFVDIVNYSASIDGYSSLCVQNYDDERELETLFTLLDQIKIRYMLITNNDYDMLKSSYIKTKSTTMSQLVKLKLNSQKNNCIKYLKIFERFDRKKQKSLEELEKIIESY